MRGIAILSIVIVGCEHPSEGTVDIIEGTYRGKLRNGELDNRVDLIDRNSSLEVEFSGDEGVLEAHITFHGKVEIDYFVGDYMLDGPESDTVYDVTVDGDELWCEYETSVKTLEVDGIFSDGREELTVDVQFLGILNLKRE